MSSIENSVSYHHTADFAFLTLPVYLLERLGHLLWSAVGLETTTVHIRCVEKSTRHFIYYLYNKILLLFMLCVYRPEENMPLNEVASDEKPPEYKEREEEDSRRNSTEKLPPA